MPLGIQRLNAPRPQPSSHITFLKPLPGPTAPHALAYLERIAAIIHPLLLHAHLTVTALEEHAPNRDFLGRNFNHGEAIQLVLRRRSRGRGSGGYDGRDSSDGDGGGWLPFRAVQMVMVHEIAHCVEMNHGRAFWALRGRLAGQLRELWERGYTGDGMWGVGRRVFGGGEGCVAGRGEDEGGAVRVCGGTFGRRGGGRKRKRKRERVGGDGRALGGDEGVKGRLEGGKNAKGRPRVAGSLRGRELRAAAAMARFEERREEGKDEESTLSGSETESEDEDAEAMGEAFEVDGSRMRDDKGRGMVKMCEDEDQDDVHVKREIEELQGLDGIGTTSRTTAARDLTAVDRTESRRAEGVAKALSHTNNDPPDRIRMEDIPQYVEKEDGPSPKNIKAVRINVRPLSHSNKDTASTIASQPKNPPATARTEISEPSEIHVVTSWTRERLPDTGGAEAMHAKEASTSMLRTADAVESVELGKTMTGPEECVGDSGWRF